jgi:hypothetical protein
MFERENGSLDDSYCLILTLRRFLTAFDNLHIILTNFENNYMLSDVSSALPRLPVVDCIFKDFD